MLALFITVRHYSRMCTSVFTYLYLRFMFIALHKGHIQSTFVSQAPANEFVKQMIHICKRICNFKRSRLILFLKNDVNLLFTFIFNHNFTTTTR